MKISVSKLFVENLNRRMGELQFTATKMSENCNLSRNTINTLRDGSHFKQDCKEAEAGLYRLAGKEGLIRE